MARSFLYLREADGKMLFFFKKRLRTFSMATTTQWKTYNRRVKRQFPIRYFLEHELPIGCSRWLYRFKLRAESTKLRFIDRQDIYEAKSLSWKKYPYEVRFPERIMHFSFDMFVDFYHDIGLNHVRRNKLKVPTKKLADLEIQCEEGLKDIFEVEDAKVFRTLYNWWMYERPNRPLGVGNQRHVIDKFNAMEDIAMQEALLKIKNYLWY
jgi:hypothetical protein